jgi:hypothetical protein
MNRQVLLAVLCVGVVVRYSPAQEYIQSRYTSQDRFDARGRYDVGPEFDRDPRGAQSRKSYVPNRPNSRYERYDDRRASPAPRQDRYSIRHASYATPATTQMAYRPTTCPSNTQRSRDGYSPDWRATTYQPQLGYRGYSPIPHSPVTPSRTYVGRGLVGQPIVYTDGQPIRNFLRSLAP